MNPFCLVGKGFKLKCNLEILTGPPMGLFLQMMPGSSSFPAYPKKRVFHGMSLIKSKTFFSSLFFLVQMKETTTHFSVNEYAILVHCSET